MNNIEDNINDLVSKTKINDDTAGFKKRQKTYGELLTQINGCRDRLRLMNNKISQTIELEPISSNDDYDFDSEMEQIELMQKNMVNNLDTMKLEDLVSTYEKYKVAIITYKTKLASATFDIVSK